MLHLKKSCQYKCPKSPSTTKHLPKRALAVHQEWHLHFHQSTSIIIQLCTSTIRTVSPRIISHHSNQTKSSSSAATLQACTEAELHAPPVFTLALSWAMATVHKDRATPSQPCRAVLKLSSLMLTSSSLTPSLTPSKPSLLHLSAVA